MFKQTLKGAAIAAAVASMLVGGPAFAKDKDAAKEVKCSCKGACHAATARGACHAVSARGACHAVSARGACHAVSARGACHAVSARGACHAVNANAG
jgi:hypothetical protein